MTQHVIGKTLNFLVVVFGVLVLYGVLTDVCPAHAQTQVSCPLPEGVAPPPDPAVTAQQVEDGSASLRDFTLAARERLNLEIGAGQYLYNLCLIRQEGGLTVPAPPTSYN